MVDTRAYPYCMPSIMRHQFCCVQRVNVYRHSHDDANPTLLKREASFRYPHIPFPYREGRQCTTSAFPNQVAGGLVSSGYWAP
jgi:hypothetical protein